MSMFVYAFFKNINKKKNGPQRIMSLLKPKQMFDLGSIPGMGFRFPLNSFCSLFWSMAVPSGTLWTVFSTEHPETEVWGKSKIGNSKGEVSGFLCLNSCVWGNLDFSRCGFCQNYAPRTEEGAYIHFRK